MSTHGPIHHEVNQHLYKTDTCMSLLQTHSHCLAFLYFVHSSLVSHVDENEIDGCNF